MKVPQEDLYMKKRQDWMQRLLFTIQSLEFCVQHSGFGYICNYEHLDDDIVKLYKLSEDELDYAEKVDTNSSYLLILLNIRK